MNTRTDNVSPQYHVVFDDTFSTVEHKRKGTVQENWEKLVEEQSVLATQEKFILVKDWYLKKSSRMILPREAWQEDFLEPGPQDFPLGYDP